ncbi:hypothetical protein [Streptomyces microflavus]|uniref:hypothetical protein n=1 Tax=Streptomyces microflavus TaxID=1919 RepID=UPI0022539769|nr:hypothetical protein [Streptomyces microflavus]MCX4657074.1 hypothetical protein [Streptomyces microflavus]WSA65089.1 hypothetical protein OHB31_35130 [Streptomyces microflavus]WSS32247.1 hypothetical protein OG269_01725 [Streptomyces microflavus]WST19222.1 hypothetical protein OG721_37020 [Streptomyces microflavus]
MRASKPVRDAVGGYRPRSFPRFPLLTEPRLSDEEPADRLGHFDSCHARHAR